MMNKDKKEKAQEQEKEFVISADEYSALKEKAQLAEQYFDKLLRIQAETENIKKRLAKEKEEFIRFANRDLIAEFVSILDDFQLAIESAEKNHDTKTLLEGVKMITKHLQDVLKNQGLAVIDKTGVMFDHYLHEAVGSAESDEVPENTVIEILRKGYMINGRVIRPAMVKVSKTKNKNTEEEKQDG